MNSKYEKYARLIIEMGVNVQKGQPLLIRAEVEEADFVRLLAKYAYERGASEVVLDWKDSSLLRMRLENAPHEVLKEIPDWAFDRMKYYYEKNACLISLSSSDPEALSGLDPKRLGLAMKAANEKFKPLDHYTMNDELAWCVASVPGKDWACRVFPDLSPERAQEMLWEAIQKAVRLDQEDPLTAWKSHIETLNARAEKLNRYHFQSLHYQSSQGTDLIVQLPSGHLWLAAESHNRAGTRFIPNMPTEEIFTLPSRTGVEGTLCSTKPLSYNGNLIEDFVFRFKDGKVTDFRAKKGEEILRSLLEEDENARRLGECALVPYDSPISNSGLLFFNTLFDENASCHFALGAAYPTCLEGGAAMTEEELTQAGANSAQVHVDFMVGSKDLKITGKTSQGEEIPVFLDGNFAF